MVGAPYNGSTNHGALYAHYGGSAGVSSGSVDKVTPSTSGARSLGYAVAGAGDVNGDGYDDVVAGSNGYRAWVFYGAATGLQSGTETLINNTDSYYGTAVDGVGDVDGDGYDDIIVGAWGADSAYLYYGSATGIVATSEELLYEGGGAQRFGWSVAGAGDLNGDGYLDIAVGATRSSLSGVQGGSAFVYYGSATGFSSANSARVDGTARYDHLGWSVQGAGDVDGDGYDDLIVGAPYDDPMGSESGAAFLYLGSATGIDTTAGQMLWAADGTGSDYFGWAVTGVGDLDGDGAGELVVGAYNYGPGAAYLRWGDCAEDADGDGVCANVDCDDDDPDAYPGATEIVGDEVDQDCDGVETCYADADDDGYTDGSTTVASSDLDCTDTGEGLATDPTGECDDTDAAIHPGATEGVGDEVDQDCDGTETCYADADDDGYTDGSTTVSSSDTDCTDAGEGLASDPTGECDDADATIHPGATEGVGDEVDQDCDDTEVCYADADDDGYTDGSTTVSSSDTDCTDAGEGVASDPTGECDDSDAAIHPGATEGVGDEVDQDCDGAETCYADLDSDGYTSGTVSSADTDCGDTGEATAATADVDCDDSAATTYPGATEVVGDEVDQSCDGAETCYADADDDGYTDGSTTVSSSDVDCADSGEGTASDPTGECDDTDPAIHPGAVEGVGDEVDQDCDGGETCYADDDDDGFTDGVTTVSSSDADCVDSGEGLATDPTGDCDDADPDAFPGATEVVGDSTDQDCDGGEICYADSDNDNFTDGVTTVVSDDADCNDWGEASQGRPAGDCDDADPDVNPDATEVCDGIDNDCDDETDEADATDAATWFADTDGDGFGDATVWAVACDAPSGHVADPTDCDDTRADVSPSGQEVCDDLDADEDCDGLVDDADDSVSADTFATWYVDGDGDGFGDATTGADSCDGASSSVTDGTDCDDTDAATFPGAEDVAGDGIDQDCDGADATSDSDGSDDDDKGGSSCAAVDAPDLGLWALVALGAAILPRRRRRDR